MYRILITGAEGFIGGHLLMHLSATNNHLIGCYLTDIQNSHLFSQLNRIRSFNASRKIEFLPLDVKNKKQVSQVIHANKIEIVFHLAAVSTVEQGLKNPSRCFFTNIDSTINILEACRSVKNIKGIIIAGSDKSYGVSAKKSGYHELQKMAGIDPYSCSKACMDLIAQSYAKIYALPVVLARCSNIYGPGDKNLTRIVPATILNILQNKPAIIHGDGEYIRDYLYVDDLIDGYLLIFRSLLQRAIQIGSAYNFGTGKGISCLEMITLIFKIAEKKMVVVHKPPNPATIKKQINNFSLAKKELKWSPKTSLKNGLLKTFNWYKKIGKNLSYDT